MTEQRLSADHAPDLDPDRILGRLAGLHREMLACSGGLTVELYHRAAVTRRCSLHDSEGLRAQQGLDEGTALRVGSRGATPGFAACSGLAAPGLAAALEHCRVGPAAPAESHEPWSAERGDRIDRETGLALPSDSVLADWIKAAVGALEAKAPAEVRVEVATTVESWYAGDGKRASRTRTRAWGLLRTVEAPRPLLIAARHWRELPPEGFRLMLEDRRLGRGGRVEPPPGPVTVLFNPECSALLVHALVRAGRPPASDDACRVGAAWKLADDPHDPTALFGGAFDDAGFPTRRTLLADGRRAVAWIDGPGHYRRPSFRDRPTPLPSQLVVLADRAEPPSRGILVTDLTLHALEPRRWLLEIEGAVIEGGLPGMRIARSFLRVRPDELPQRCVAAVGPPRPSHLGVRTPALVFDALTCNPSRDQDKT